MTAAGKPGPPGGRGSTRAGRNNAGGKTMQDFIRVVGARQHNLKNVSLDIPKNRIVVFTGVSGSGKSSLVFDTVCAEAQRQLIETFSAFARRRLPKISKPHVEEIENLSTAMVIDQKRLGTTLRSTVGTVTEIFTHLRMLYSRCGEPFIGFSNAFSFNNPEGMCPQCNGLGKEMVVDMDRILDREKSVEQGAVLHSNFKPGGWYWKGLMKCGFFDPRKPVRDFTAEELHNLLHREKTAFINVLRGEEYTSQYEGIVTNLKRRFVNRDEGEDAYTRFFTYQDCAECRGSRISEAARNVKVQGVTIPELVFLELPEVLKFVESVRGPVAEPLVRKMKQSLANLVDIGVGYLSLHRPGGDAFRGRVAAREDGLAALLQPREPDVHPRRAQYRPAPARRREPAAHAGRTQGEGQLAARGGARPGRDPGRRLYRGHGPGRRLAGRGSALYRNGRGIENLGHPDGPIPGAEEKRLIHPAGSGGLLRDHGCHRPQPEARIRPDPGRGPRLRHGRGRLRQEQPDPRRVLPEAPGGGGDRPVTRGPIQPLEPGHVRGRVRRRAQGIRRRDGHLPRPVQFQLGRGLPEVQGPRAWSRWS